MSRSFVSSAKSLVVKEFARCSAFEISFFFFTIGFVVFSSIYKHDCVLALISAVCGVIYTMLAGKGKIYCYFFGIIGTLCCAYLSYDIALYGNFALHFLYYFPMEVVGFFTWRKHLDKSTNEIIKEKLSAKEFSAMILLVTLATAITYMLFIRIGDKSPFIDAAMTVLSVAGMVLTVRRSIEQWLVWTLVNFLSIIMWFNAYQDGEKIFSIFVVRILYFILGIYFFFKWKKAAIKL